MRLCSIPLAIVATFAVVRAQAGGEVTATKSLTVQSTGPRPRDNGKKYFNIEGKDNDKYASFGVLVFEMPKEIDASKLESVKLTLVQSVARFSKDGAVKLYLAPDLDPATELKFDSASENGVGDQVKKLQDLGSGTVKKVKTGESQSFTLKLDDPLREQITNGGRLCLKVVPADSAVAATYCGVGDSDEGRRPEIKLEVP